MEFDLPDQFKEAWAVEYIDNRRKFHEPTKRRARRHFDEDLAWFCDRYEGWLGCKGSNHDAASMSSEDREIAFVLHRGLVWLRHTYTELLAAKMKNGKGYVPHDMRGKLSAMREFLIEQHNKGEITFQASWAAENGISRSDVSRDFI